VILSKNRIQTIRFFTGLTGILVVCSEKKVVFLEYKQNGMSEAFFSQESRKLPVFKREKSN
jgi:hypothetical protein